MEKSKHMTTVDILINYVKENDLEYHYKEELNKHYLLSTDPIDKSKVFWYKKGIANNNIFYCAYDTWATRLGYSNTFSGVFVICDFCKIDNDQLVIRKVDFMDRIAGIFTRHNFAFKNIFIETQNNATIPPLFKSTNVLNQVNDILNGFSPILLGINKPQINFIPDFVNKSYIGFYTNLTWLTDFKVIDLLMTHLSEIIKLPENIKN
jgi:hypothetical protein